MEHEEEIIRGFAERLTACEQSTKQAHKRIDNLDRLTESVYTLATEVKLMREDTNDIKLRVEAIEQRPIKHWDMLVTTCITAIASGIIGFVLSNLLH